MGIELNNLYLRDEAQKWVPFKDWDISKVVDENATAPTKVSDFLNAVSLNSGGLYGECTTAQNSAGKIVTCSTNFALKVGTKISVKFINGGAHETAITMNVNDTGAKGVKFNIDQFNPSSSKPVSWNKNSILDFVYNGTNWICLTPFLWSDVTSYVPLLDKSPADTGSLYYNSGVLTSGIIPSANIPDLNASKITVGTLGVAHGGTSLTAAPSMLVNLASTATASVFTASPRPGVTGTLTVSHGGTGITAVSATNAVVIGNSSSTTGAMQTVTAANGAFYSTGANVKPTFGTLPIKQGGTGKTTATEAWTNLGGGSIGKLNTISATNISSVSASVITGTLGVAHGGTGKSTLTDGSYLIGNGTSAVELKTPAQVLSDIGAAAASHTHTKTMDRGDNLGGITIAFISMAGSKYTSVAVTGWSYRKYLVSGASMYMYHAIGLVKVPASTAVTTQRGGIFVSSVKYIRLPHAARVLQCVMFGTSMGGGDNGLTCNNAGSNNAGDWHAIDDSLYNIPVVVASPVSITTSADQYIPVDVWFSATN